MWRQVGSTLPADPDAACTAGSENKRSETKDQWSFGVRLLGPDSRDSLAMRPVAAMNSEAVPASSFR